VSRRSSVPLCTGAADRRRLCKSEQARQHTRGSAETYARESYAGVLKTLQPMIQGEPSVQTHDVASSTFHKIAKHATA
jgi:hypothetical protein